MNETKEKELSGLGWWLMMSDSLGRLSIALSGLRSAAHSVCLRPRT
jgi:hypothetical protein